MKITDKTKAPTADHVVNRGDILQRKHPVFGTTYYFVGASNSEQGGNNLISLEHGSNYTDKFIPAGSTLRYYKDHVFFEGNYSVITHIPSSQLELVIGG